jgi:branched-chain amino acid transport system substrate-binding protein
VELPSSTKFDRAAGGLRRHTLAGIAGLVVVLVGVAACSSSKSKATTPSSSASTSTTASSAASGSTSTPPSSAASGSPSTAASSAASGSVPPSAAASSASGKPVKIGVSVSLSGDFSADGLATKQGYQTWAAYQNAHGGILGRPIVMDFLSDGSSPTQIVTNYQKLITVDKVDFTLGPYSTLLTKPASVITNRYGYVMLEGIGGGPSVFSQGLKNVFDVSASATYQMVTVAKWIAATQTPQPIAYATMDDPFIKPTLDGARSYLDGKGFTEATYKVYPLETTDFTAIASAIAATHAKIVLLGTMPPDGYAMIQDFIQDKYNMNILAEASGPDQGAQFLKAIGASNAEAVMVPNTWYPDSTFFQNSDMVAEYLKMFGGTKDAISADVAEAFAAGQVLVQGVAHNNSLSNSDLQTYLHSGASFQSVQGPVMFGSDGQNVGATPYIFQWQHGTFVPVLPTGGSDIKAVEIPKPAWGSGG